MAIRVGRSPYDKTKGERLEEAKAKKEKRAGLKWRRGHWIPKDESGSVIAQAGAYGPGGAKHPDTIAHKRALEILGRQGTQGIEQIGAKGSQALAEIGERGEVDTSLQALRGTQAMEQQGLRGTQAMTQLNRRGEIDTSLQGMRGSQALRQLGVSQEHERDMFGRKVRAEANKEGSLLLRDRAFVDLVKRKRGNFNDPEIQAEMLNRGYALPKRPAITEAKMADRLKYMELLMSPAVGMSYADAKKEVGFSGNEQVKQAAAASVGDYAVETPPALETPVQKEPLPRTPSERAASRMRAPRGESLEYLSQAERNVKKVFGEPTPKGLTTLQLLKKIKGIFGKIETENPFSADAQRYRDLYLRNRN